MSGSETQIKAADASPAAPTVMPWRYALSICAAALVLGIAGFALTGSAGSMAATAGFAVGLFAALSGGLKQALVAWLGFIAAAALILTFPVLPVLLALCISLSALAAVEVARSGTRVAVMALMGIILFAIATERGGDASMLALAALGFWTGYLVVGHLDLSAILRAPRASLAEAVRLGLFLAVGVALSIGLAMTLDLPHAYWIVIMFVSRSLMPAQDKPGALLKYGRGAALGILAAILIELAGTPDAGLMLLALAAFVVGLRFMPHPLPISSAAMTAGVLLASAPTPDDATFRAEAVVLFVALIALLSLIIDFILKRRG
ncbi:MAG: hypothetical protein ACNA7O_15735 [Rhodobacterales bacterium]